MNDIFFMTQALKLAEHAAKIGEVPVGAVVVYHGKIISSSYNRREIDQNALAHAELLAIAKSCKKLGSWRLNDCTLYVTLEPCPMCTGAIINSRVERVVFGASDPKAGSCGSVIDLNDYPYNHKPEIISGILQQECSNILSNFFRQLRKKKTKKGIIIYGKCDDFSI